MFKKILNGISNLKYYFKTIWNDNDNDYYFILEILIKKLEKSERYWGNYTSYENDYDDKEKLQSIIIELKIIQIASINGTDDSKIKKDLEKSLGKLARILPKLWD